MALLLQFFGISDPVHLFELEQRYPRGPVFAGFRPCQLDRLLSWGQQAANSRQWEPDQVHQAVLRGWLEREDLIRQWQRLLGSAPDDQVLVTGLGSERDWQQRCEQMFQV